jgi:hypothetical protein
VHAVNAVQRGFLSQEWAPQHEPAQGDERERRRHGDDHVADRRNHLGPGDSGDQLHLFLEVLFPFEGGGQRRRRHGWLL